MAEFYWIQFDSKELREAREFLSSLEKGTVDELGLLKLRNYFADIFFPATTTLLSSSRYMIFLPAIVMKASQSKNPETELETLQDKLRERLEESDEYGVIGRVSKDKLERYPDVLYWGAMRSLGLFESNNSVNSVMSQIRFQSKENESYSSEDSGLEEDQIHIFDPKVLKLSSDALFDTKKDKNGKKIYLDKKFKEKINFKLSKEEKNYLKNCYKDNFENSLMTLVINNPDYMESDDSLWGIKIPKNHELNQIQYDARCFSLLATGAGRLFQYLKAKKSKNSVYRDAVLDVLKFWFESDETKAYLSQWDLKQALDVLNTKQVLNANRGDRSFLTAIYMTYSDSKNLDEFIKKLSPEIIKREKKVKPGREKLSQKTISIPEDTQLPKKDLYYLDYRAPYGIRFLKEFLDTPNKKKKAA